MKRCITPVYCIIAVIVGQIIAFNIVSLPAQLELVALISLLLFYPVFRYPKCGVYIIFFLMPFVPFFRRLYYLVYLRPDADPLIILGDILTIFITTGLLFVFRKYSEDNNGLRVFTTVVLCYFIYVIFRTFVFNSNQLREGVLNLRFYAPQVLMFFIGITFSKDFKMLKKLWLITFLIAFITAMYGINQLFWGYSEAERIWFSSISFTSLFIEGMARPFSTFQSPAAFADYLQLGIIAVLILYSWSNSAKGKFFLLFIPLFFYGILITSVRSNWAGMVISLLVWFTILAVKGNKRRLAVLVVMILAYFGAQFIQLGFEENPFLRSAPVVYSRMQERDYISMLVTDRIGALVNPFVEYSMVSRLALWRYVFASSLNPLYAILGRGTGTFSSDSIYFDYLAQFGYPGLLFIISLIAAFIIYGIRLIDSSKDRSVIVLAKGITVFNITFAIINFTGTHIHSFPGDSYFWFWNGVLVSLYFSRNVNTDKAMGSDENHGNA
ncbi:Membrane protein of EXOQ family, involved in exopolysaccharide production [Chitinispirillum alkaliphilum]|nr:Membrane protein of EXOQ family, involved in exopolysaccharide production [Chitinispirillum alkaliphilum]